MWYMIFLALTCQTEFAAGGGGLHTVYSGLYGEVRPKRDTFFVLAVCERVGKFAVSVY